MQQTTKDIKLITLSLLLRTMPKHEQSLVMSHFSPEVVSRLNEIEQEAGADIEKIDWRPFTRYWGDLRKIIDEYPNILITAPHFTPIRKVDEVKANKDITLNINLDKLPTILPNKIEPRALNSMSINEIFERILKAHEEYK